MNNTSYSFITTKQVAEIWKLVDEPATQRQTWRFHGLVFRTGPECRGSFQISIWEWFTMMNFDFCSRKSGLSDF